MLGMFGEDWCVIVYLYKKNLIKNWHRLVVVGLLKKHSLWGSQGVVVLKLITMFLCVLIGYGQGGDLCILVHKYLHSLSIVSLVVVLRSNSIFSFIDKMGYISFRHLK